MAVETFARASTATSALLLAEAAEYQGQQIAGRVEAQTAILATYATLQTKDALASWTAGIGERLYVLLSVLQELLATDAIAYVYRILALQGLRPTGPRPNPLAFAGIATDGRDLESLLAGAVVKVRQAQRAGESDAEARRRGENYLRLVVATQAADTARAAESVALTTSEPVVDQRIPQPAERRRPVSRETRPVEMGWIRMLNPPSCGRCAVLAGRWYRWSDGFERHEMCDCRHIPVTENLAGDLTTDVDLYFASLSEEEQNYYFGKAVAQAIRDGADISQVVNAATRPDAMYTADRGRRYTTEGTTRQGWYGRRRDQVRRPTPWQIYSDAAGDREAAVEELRRFGYILR